MSTLKKIRKTRLYFDERARKRDFSKVCVKDKLKFIQEYANWRIWKGVILESIRPHLNRQSFVLDAGCGTGELSSLLREFTGLVVSFDFSRQSVIRTAKKADMTILADINDIPFASESFDIVISCEVIEHLESPIHAIEELIRVCRTEGIICITTPNPLCIFLPVPYWVSLLRHPRKWVRRLRGKVSWSNAMDDFWIFPWKLRTWLRWFHVSILRHKFFMLLTDQSLLTGFGLKYLSPEAFTHVVYSAEKFEVIPFGIRQLILGKKA